MTDTFLGLNGMRLTASDEAVIAFCTGLYETHEFNFKNLVSWLRANTELISH